MTRLVTSATGRVAECGYAVTTCGYTLAEFPTRRRFHFRSVLWRCRLVTAEADRVAAPANKRGYTSPEFPLWPSKFHFRSCCTKATGGYSSTTLDWCHAPCWTTRSQTKLSLDRPKNSAIITQKRQVSGT